MRSVLFCLAKVGGKPVPQVYVVAHARDGVMALRCYGVTLTEL